MSIYDKRMPIIQDHEIYGLSCKQLAKKYKAGESTIAKILKVWRG